MVLRSNSLATKAIELYLKQVGGVYLKAALGDFVNSVLLQTASTETATPQLNSKEKRNSLGRLQSTSRRGHAPSSSDFESSTGKAGIDFEVDPDKVPNSHQLLRNQANLMRLVRDVWRRIQATISSFPKLVFLTVHSVYFFSVRINY